MLIKQEEGRTSAPLPRSTIAASKDKTPEEANVPRTYEMIDLTMDDDDDDDEDNDEDEDEESDGGGKKSEDNEDNEGNEDDTDHEDTEDNGDNDSDEVDDDDDDDDNDARATQCADVPTVDQAQATTSAPSILSSPSPSLATERVLSIEPPPKSSLTKKRSRQVGVVDLITHLLAGGGECGRMSKVRKPNPSNDGGEDNRMAAKKEPAKDSDRTEGPSMKKMKKERSKYRVTWKEDSLLEEVRLFHKSEEEIEGNGLGLSHQDEGAVLRRKKEALEWHDPIPLNLPPLVEEINRSKVAMAGEEGLWFHEEENLLFDADDPQAMDIMRAPECRLGGEHTSLLTETAEIPWPDILLEGMEGVEYPEPMLESPQQILLPTLSLHRPPAPPPPPSTSPSLLPPRLRPASPLTQEHRRALSSEGRHQHHSEWTDERQCPGKDQLRRQSTDASYLTSSNKLPLPDRPGLRRYSMPERPQGRRTSTANDEYSRRSSPSDRSEREAERVPIPERPQGGRERSPCEKSSWEKGKARYEQREDNEPGKRYRFEREEEYDWEILRREERDSSKSYHYERRSWRYNEEREREEQHDRHYQRERRIEEVEEDRSFRRPSTGERGGTHGDRGGGGGGTTPPTPTHGRNGDVKVPRRHNSLSSHDRPGQHKSDKYGYGSKQSTYWNNNQDVTYPYRPYTRPDRESERRMGTKEKSEGARS